MKNHFLVFGFFAAGIFLLGCKPEAAESADADDAAAPAMTHQDSVKRGEYLVTIMGCEDCHSPKIFTKEGMMLFDSTRMLSGHPAADPLPKITDKAMIVPGQWLLFGPDLTSYVGPWGTSFSANLTPDPSGLGDWNIDQFKRAFQHGKYKGMDNGRPIMPPMPWQNFAHASNEDVHMIWTFLRSIKPISNVVPAYIPPGQK